MRTENVIGAALPFYDGRIMDRSHHIQSSHLDLLDRRFVKNLLFAATARQSGTCGNTRYSNYHLLKHFVSPDFLLRKISGFPYHSRLPPSASHGGSDYTADFP